MCSHASWIICGIWNDVISLSTYQLLLRAKMLVTISDPRPTIERPPSVHNYCGGSVSYTAMNCIALLLNLVLHSQSLQYVLVVNFTNMHAWSHRSDFFACSCGLNIEQPAVCITLWLLSAVFEVRLPSIQILTAMSDPKSLNSSLFEVMISSNNECVFIRDLGDLTFQIVFDAWWASINVGSKRPIAWNDSRHALSWLFYLHCGIGEIGSPDIICIVWP